MDKYYDIILTDLQLHAVKPTNPPSLWRQVLRSLRNGLKPGRAYGKVVKTDNGEFRFEIPMTKDLQEQMDVAKRLGKEVRFFMPKGGIPVYPGPDTIQRINADRKKMINRLTR